MFTSLESPLDIVEMSSVGSRDYHEIYILVFNDLLVCLDNLDIVPNDRSTGLFTGSLEDRVNGKKLW